MILSRLFPAALPRTIALSAVLVAAIAQSDTVEMKTGLVYKGLVDRDNTVVSIDDGLKRVIVRDSKIARIERNQSFPNLEGFLFVQPLLVHAGEMPTYAIQVEASEWDERGRRDFSYVGPRSSKPVRMRQAINDLSPRIAKLRGIDGFWVGQVPTWTLPKSTITSLLGKVERDNQAERLRVGRFLIQLEWYPEAKAELDRLAADFPDLKETVNSVRQSIIDLEARQLLSEIETRTRAAQPGRVLELLQGFPTEGVSEELSSQVRDRIRLIEERKAGDLRLGEGLRSLAKQLPEAERGVWEAPLTEVLKALEEAPDAVRGRLEAYETAEPSKPVEARFALAMSGWALGSDEATEDLAATQTTWKVREIVEEYLVGGPEFDRDGLLESLKQLGPEMKTVWKVAKLLPPPIRRGATASPGTVTIHRVRDDQNEEPSEYAVLLPPEYHPLRAYPTVVALNSGREPQQSGDKDAGLGVNKVLQSAIGWWAAEAARRGYIVIAPEYNLPNRSRAYRYTVSEHAAVELALRDARRRYSIDGDRVFLGGQLEGANMAWDYGLAHPDQFAGVVAISGLPAKYVHRYLPHTDLLPFYIVEGDLAPASLDLIFSGVVKPMIERAWDVTYVSHYRRGLEELNEEAGPSFDWMDRRKRGPSPRSFKVESARPSDNRFFGVVIHDYLPGRTTAPEAVEPLGKNLSPAKLEYRVGAQNNLLTVQLSGIKRLDLWLSPENLDFSRRIEIRVNGKTYFKGVTKPDYGPMLDDLRMRGDREQMYWYRFPLG